MSEGAMRSANLFVTDRHVQQQSFCTASLTDFSSGLGTHFAYFTPPSTPPVSGISHLDLTFLFMFHNV